MKRQEGGDKGADSAAPQRGRPAFARAAVSIRNSGKLP
jgi:hypothetical protein